MAEQSLSGIIDYLEPFNGFRRADRRSLAAVPRYSKGMNDENHQKIYSLSTNNEGFLVCYCIGKSNTEFRCVDLSL